MRVIVILTVAVLAVVLYLIRNARRTRDQEPKRRFIQTNRIVGAPQWVGTLIGIGMGLLFLGLGIWMVYMGVIGRSPAATMPPAKAKIILMMGVLFAFGGIQAAVKVILGDNLPKMVDRIMLSLFLVFLGIPFIAIPILDPGGISSSVSVNETVMHTSKGSSVGTVVFMVVGVLCLVGAFWPWRWWKKNR